MPERIDHVIAAASDFAALEAAFTRLGFHITGGGTHPHLGTRNRIVVLGEGYLELLGIADTAYASPALNQRLARDASGWVGFALQSSDITTEVAAMRERGVDVRGPFPGRLVAPNGTARSWRVAMCDTDDLWAAAEPVPFLIQHDTTSPAHQLELAGEGGLAPHANGAQRIPAITLAVRDLDGAAATFARIYDLHPMSAPRRDDDLAADVLELGLTGGERLVLARPAGPGIVQQRLETTGEGACSLSIAVGSHVETEAFLRARGIAYTTAGSQIAIAPRETLGIPLRFVADS